MNDWLGSWGSPDDLIKSVLIWIFGSSSLVVTVFVIVNGALGYRDTARSVLAGFRKARSSLISIRRTRPPSAGATAFMHILVLILQAAWLLATYAIGVIIASDVGAGPRVTDASVESASGFLALLGNRSGVATGVLAGAALAILISYGRARTGSEDVDWLIVVFGGLPIIFAWMGLVGAGLSALVWAIGGGKDDPYANGQMIFILFCAAAAMYMYYKACCVAFNGPKLLYRMRQELLAFAAYDSTT